MSQNVLGRVPQVKQGPAWLALRWENAWYAMYSTVTGNEKQHISVHSLVGKHSRNSKIFMEERNFKHRLDKYSRGAKVQMAS